MRLEGRKNMLEKKTYVRLVKSKIFIYFTVLVPIYVLISIKLELYPSFALLNSSDLDTSISLPMKIIHSENTSNTQEHFTTVVSMYFKLVSSKHKTTEYNAWIKNMLKSVQAPLVMYTDYKSIDFLQANRNNSAKQHIMCMVMFGTY